MYVVPEHRKKGYFRELYAYVKKEALASKACGLRLYADNGNTRAHMAVGEDDCIRDPYYVQIASCAGSNSCLHLGTLRSFEITSSDWVVKWNWNLLNTKPQHKYVGVLTIVCRTAGEYMESLVR